MNLRPKPSSPENVGDAPAPQRLVIAIRPEEVRLVVGVLAAAVLVYWLPRVLGLETEGGFDAFAYARAVLDDATEILEHQPFLRPYFWFHAVPPEFFAVALHLGLILPALRLLRRSPHGASFVVPTTAALILPEFLLFMGAASKEGLAIAGVVWLVLAFCRYLDGNRVVAIAQVAWAAAIFEFSRPAFGVVPLGVLALTLASVTSGRRRLVLAAISAVGVSAVALKWYPQIQETYSEKLEAGLAFLEWFEQNMESSSAAKDFFRKALSIGLVGLNLHWSLLIGVLAAALVAKVALYTFAIPLIALPEYSVSGVFIWNIAWQVAVTVSSLVMLASVRSLFPRSGTRDPEKVFLVRFAVLFAIAIASSSFILHVRYRAPAQLLLLITAFRYGGVPRWFRLPMTGRRHEVPAIAQASHAGPSSSRRSGPATRP